MLNTYIHTYTERHTYIHVHIHAFIYTNTVNASTARNGTTPPTLNRPTPPTLNGPTPPALMCRRNLPMQGTPVLDIKPYIPDFDSHGSDECRIPWWIRWVGITCVMVYRPYQLSHVLCMQVEILDGRLFVRLCFESDF